jgi:hypothetical protein
MDDSNPQSVADRLPELVETGAVDDAAGLLSGLATADAAARTDEIGEAITTPDGGDCPNCGLSLSETGTPTCPRCGNPY